MNLIQLVTWGVTNRDVLLLATICYLVPYLEFFLCAGFNIVTSFLALDNDSVLVHAVAFGHVLVAEQTTVGNVGGVDGGGEEQEGQDT